MTIGPEDLPAWLFPLALGLIAFVIGLALSRALTRLADYITQKNFAGISRYNLRRLHGPIFVLSPLITVYAAYGAFQPQVLQYPAASAVIKISLVCMVYWLAMTILHVATLEVLRRYNIGVKDNLRARRVHTQIAVVRRIASVLIFVLAAAAIFLMFDKLRGLGVSLLASAGVAGLVIGFAAQKTLGNLLAGIQIALTQPIRLEDAVVVEGEWGWIEEITLTYVVIRIWDWRRLVLPISYFIEKPFQNWTRNSARIIGSVEFYADYTLPVEAVREKLDEVLTRTTLWDGEVKVVQVTEADKATMKLRILLSAEDSPTAWDLRCFVREEIIGFIHRTYPQSLPRTRAEMETPGPAGMIPTA